MIKFCRKCQAETERRADGGCAPCSKAYAVKWRAENPERMRALSAAWYAANTEKVKAGAAKWISENVDKHRASTAKYRINNPDAYRIYAQNRRALKREGGKLSKDIAERLFKLQRGKCACGCRQALGDDYHLDHRMPLALGGSNTDDNIQLLREKCNLQKNAKHPVDFMQQRGFLL